MLMDIPSEKEARCKSEHTKKKKKHRSQLYENICIKMVMEQATIHTFIKYLDDEHR